MNIKTLKDKTFRLMCFKSLYSISVLDFGILKPKSSWPVIRCTFFGRDFKSRIKNLPLLSREMCQKLQNPAVLPRCIHELAAGPKTRQFWESFFFGWLLVAWLLHFRLTNWGGYLWKFLEFSSLNLALSLELDFLASFFFYALN